MTGSKRNVFIIDRTLWATNNLETRKQVVTSLPVLARIYANIDKSPALIEYFDNPATEEHNLILVFHMDQVHGMRRKVAGFSQRRPEQFPYIMQEIFNAIGAKDPPMSVYEIPVMRESDFEALIDFAVSMEDHLTKGTPL